MEAPKMCFQNSKISRTMSPNLDDYFARTSRKKSRSMTFAWPAFTEVAGAAGAA